MKVYIETRLHLLGGEGPHVSSIIYILNLPVNKLSVCDEGNNAKSSLELQLKKKRINLFPVS